MGMAAPFANTLFIPTIIHALPSLGLRITEPRADFITSPFSQAAVFIIATVITTALVIKNDHCIVKPSLVSFLFVSDLPGGTVGESESPGVSDALTRRSSIMSAPSFGELLTLPK